jgi:MFS family permease
MYAFRKPVAAGTFLENEAIWGLQYKTAVVIIQLIGYVVSKFIGIKFIAEMNGTKRAYTLIGLVLFAQLTWLGFALVPQPYNLIFPFLNGLPLGMIWGIVFSYLEGRRFTEFMGLALSASFIFASAFVKDAAKWLMDLGVTEFWMPFATGLLFIIPLVIFALLLNQVPAPTQEDEALKTKRKPMLALERKQFFWHFSLGLTLLIIVYIMLSIYRDFRDNFMAEIFNDLKLDKSTFTNVELWVSVAVLLLLALIVFIRNNKLALQVNLFAVLIGFLVMGIATLGNMQGWLANYWWMFATGFGAYIAYIPFNSILFDRLIAAFKKEGNTGFLIYLADSFGYLGSLLVMFYRNFGQADLSWAVFFAYVSLAFAVLGSFFTISSMVYFQKKE